MGVQGGCASRGFRPLQGLILSFSPVNVPLSKAQEAEKLSVCFLASQRVAEMFSYIGQSMHHINLLILPDLVEAFLLLTVD